MPQFGYCGPLPTTRLLLPALAQEFEAVIRMVMLDQAKGVPPLRCKPRPGGGTPAALDDASLPL